MFLPAAFAIFAASGFAGLIYESIWSHYLKLLLGHAAYAQTLVLALFMGGMAVGAWLASRLSVRWRDLILAYALIEALIGVASLAFHQAFVGASAFAFDTVIPRLASPIAIEGFKWAVAGALILPQAVLLGMTFPLMTGGVLRVRPERSGFTVAMLYFTNSLGAAVGVLASGFHLIEEVGLPGAMAAAAVVNLAVAAAAMLLPRAAGASVESQRRARAEPSATPDRSLLLAVAALTGLSSFMYEIGWIRMLALVLGSSTHAFELMLSAFILGIACGGLWVRRRIDAAGDTVRLLAYVQLVMGLAALATLPVYGSTFRVMQFAVQSLAPTEGGYLAFNLLSHAICLAVMFPAAFCAGMTLPLVTATLLRRGAGERAIGQVYAANTAGGIAGVLLAVHLGFALLGLKGIIVAGAAIDLGLGIVLLSTGQARAPRRAAAAGALGAAALLAVLVGVRLDAHRLSSGVYLYGQLGKPGAGDVLLQLDGKTATVSVTGGPEALALRTNGKSDGTVRMDGAGPTRDEATMTLAGALPQLLAPDARRVANIGFGTGMTTHVLLASPSIEAVDTVEIEPAIVEAAARFRPLNARALDDPRSHVHYEDAKTYFSARRLRYDVIVSEPSNPWVSGVASLYSTEFYRDARRHIREGGLLVQWIHLYHMTPALLATVIAAIEENFSDYELWMPNGVDLIIVAANGGVVPRPDARALQGAALRAELARFRIAGLDDLLTHRVAGRAAIGPYYAAFGAQANSDYFPVLDRKAAMHRFMRSDATDIIQLLEAPLPVLRLLDGGADLHPDPARLTGGPRPWWPRPASVAHALDAVRYLRTGDHAALTSGLAAELTLARAALVECRLVAPAPALRSALDAVAWHVNRHLPAPQAQAIWELLENPACVRQLGDSERRWLRLHAAVPGRDGARLAQAARAILEAETDLEPEATATVLAALMTGLILANDRPAAMAAFARYRGKVSRQPAWQTLFRFLVGHAQPRI